MTGFIVSNDEPQEENLKISELNTEKAQDQGMIYVSNVHKITNLSVSPTNKNLLAFTSADFTGLYLYNRLTREQITLTQKPGVGYKYSWSSDGESICFRVTNQNGSSRY